MTYYFALLTIVGPVEKRHHPYDESVNLQRYDSLGTVSVDCACL